MKIRRDSRPTVTAKMAICQSKTRSRMAVFPMRMRFRKMSGEKLQMSSLRQKWRTIPPLTP